MLNEWVSRKDQEDMIWHPSIHPSNIHPNCGGGAVAGIEGGTLLGWKPSVGWTLSLYHLLFTPPTRDSLIWFFLLLLLLSLLSAPIILWKKPTNNSPKRKSERARCQEHLHELFLSSPSFSLLPVFSSALLLALSLLFNGSIATSHTPPTLSISPHFDLLYLEKQVLYPALKGFGLEMSQHLCGDVLVGVGKRKRKRRRMHACGCRSCIDI